MKTYLLYLVLMLPSLCQGQRYFNKIVPFPFGNPNPIQLTYHDGQYLIPVIYPGDSATLIVTDFDNDSYYHYEKFDFSSYSATIINDVVFLYAKDRSQAKGLQMGMLKQDFALGWKIDIPTPGDFNFPTSSIAIGQNILGSYSYDENNISKMGVFCFGPDGLLRWNNIYEANIRNSIIWRLHASRSNDLLASYAILYKNEFESVARVMKIDTLGNELWKSDSLRGIFDVNSQVSIVELSDSSIFVTFKKDMHKDLDFFMKLHPYPPTYVWLDKDGRKVREQVLRISRNYEVYISEVKAGRGDYFYVYGGLRYFDTNDDYGFITKYANNGDTIWTHRYRHPAFNSSAYIYYIDDIIEEDNGDITALGTIIPVGGKNEVWAFRVDSEGCYGTQTCDDLVLSTHGDADAAHGMTVYPNPTTGMINIEGLPVGAGAVVRIYSSDGRLCYSGRGEQIQKIDIRHLPAGVYIAQVSSRRWSQAYKIIKQ